MARLPRLAADRQLHHVIHRAAAGRPVGGDARDRSGFVDALLGVSRDLRVAIHAYAVLPDAVQLLLTPPDGAQVATLMQRMGRRHAGELNRRHGTRGSPWAGRYRVSVLEPQRHLFDAMRLIDTAAVAAGLVERPEAWEACSAAHHLGQRADPLVTDHPGWWALGNTPFEREMAWRRLCEEPLPPATRDALLAAAEGGWALGDDTFLATIASGRARPLQPRPRGRPRKPSS